MGHPGNRLMERFIPSGGPVAAQLSPSFGRAQLFEYAFYAAVFYGYMGEALGLSINMLGAGMIVGLAVLCTPILGTQILSFAFGFPILFAVSFTFVQKMVHGESLADPYIKPVLIWILTVIIVSALCRRSGFIPRFAAAQFFIGLAALPFVDLNKEGRAAVDAAVGVLRNPNGLSVFFGFIAVAFTVRSTVSHGNLARGLHVAIALFSLFMVALTVSRGTLAACGVAIVVALRKQLRRSFIPILVLVALAGGAFAAGLFDDVLSSYSERGLEDTGRYSLWPLAFGRFIESPLAGVGVSKTYIELPTRKEPVTPHNSFLFVGLSSGIIPLMLFAGYWLLGLRGALKASRKDPAYPYLLPLWVYAFFLDQSGSQYFVEPWSTFCVCICLVQLIPKQPRRFGIGGARLELNLPQGRVLSVARPLWTRK